MSCETSMSLTPVAGFLSSAPNEGKWLCCSAMCVGAERWQ